MTDLTFLVQVILSIAAIAVPIGVILALLVTSDVMVADLFMAPSWEDHYRTPASADEEIAPRWRLERLHPRARPDRSGAQASSTDRQTTLWLSN